MHTPKSVNSKSTVKSINSNSKSNSKLLSYLGFPAENMPETVARYARAYLDPNHTDHISQCLGIPIGSSQKHYIYHRKLSQTINAPTSDDNSSVSLMIYMLPFPECPIVYRNGAGKFIAVTDPTLGPHYFRDNKVYSFRPIGQGLTVKNPYAQMYIQGNVAACRIAPMIDNHGVYIETLKSQRFIRVLDGLPLSYEETTAYSGYYSGLAKDGVYIPNRMFNSTFEFINRDCDWNKSIFTRYKYPTQSDAGMPVGDVELMNTVAINTPSGWEFVTTDGGTPSSANTIPVTSLSGSGFMVGVVALDGLAPGQPIQLTFTHAYECLVKPTSVFVPTLQSPVPPELDLLQVLFQYLVREQQAYPADFNFWGELWNGFKNFWRKLRPVTSAALQILPAPYKPIANTIAGGVDRIVG